MDIEGKNNNVKNSNSELDDSHGNIVLKHSLVLVG